MGKTSTNAGESCQAERVRIGRFQFEVGMGPWTVGERVGESVHLQ